MDLCLDRHVISLPLNEELVARWIVNGGSTPSLYPLKAAWALLMSRVSGLPSSEFGVHEMSVALVSDSKVKLARSKLPYVETWMVSDNPDIALCDAAKEHTACLVKTEVTTAIIISWDGKIISVSR